MQKISSFQISNEKIVFDHALPYWSLKLKPKLSPMNASDSNSFPLGASKNKRQYFRALVRGSREKIISNMTAFIGGNLGLNLRTLFLFFILPLLSSCTYRVVQRIDSDEISRAIVVYSEKLKYEKHLDLDDSLICYDEHITRIRLDFSSMDILFLCDARPVLVDLVDGFLERINENLQIVSSSLAAPLTPENLEIYIRYISFYNKYVDENTISLITLRNGIANYIAGDAFDCTKHCWHRRREYYYQSQNFVNFQRQGEALYKPRPQKKPSVLKDERFYPVDIVL